MYTYASLCVGVLTCLLAPSEVRRGRQRPCRWSYRQPWAAWHGVGNQTHVLFKSRKPSWSPSYGSRPRFIFKEEVSVWPGLGPMLPVFAWARHEWHLFRKHLKDPTGNQAVFAKSRHRNILDFPQWLLSRLNISTSTFLSGKKMTLTHCSVWHLPVFLAITSLTQRMPSSSRVLQSIIYTNSVS